MDPAGIAGDEAGGLVWSPRDGVVISIGLDGSDPAELRKVVDGIRFG